MILKHNDSELFVIAYTYNNDESITYLCSNYSWYTDDEVVIKGNLLKEYKVISKFYNESIDSIVFSEIEFLDINLFYYIVGEDLTGDNEYNHIQEEKKKRLDLMISSVEDSIRKESLNWNIKMNNFNQWESTSFGKQIIDFGNNSYYIDDPVYDIFFKKDEHGNNVDIEVINK